MAHSGEIEKLERRWMDNPTGLTFAPLAEAYRRAGDHPRALEVLELGLAQHPAYVPALIVRARCHLDARLDGEAETSFHAVLSSDPHNLIALKGLADLCELTERLPGALGFLDRLLEADPTHGEGASQRERIAALIGERDAARGAPTSPGDPSDPAPLADLERIVPLAPEVVPDPDPAAELEAVVVGDIERSSEFDASPIGAELPDPAAAVEEHPAGETVPADEVAHPLEGFDASAWDLPFDATELPTQAFDEHLGLEAMEEAPAAVEGQSVPEDAPAHQGEPSDPGPVIELEAPELLSPWSSAEAADTDPVEWNPAGWGGEQIESQPADAPDDQPGSHLSDADASERASAEAGTPVDGAPAVVGSAEPWLAPDAPAPEVIGPEFPEAPESVADTGEPAAEAEEVTPPAIAEPVSGGSVYFGAVHGATDAPEATTEPVSEWAPAPPAEPEAPESPHAEVAEPVQDVADAPSPDLRLEGETYLALEHGWLSSTDWSSPEPVVLPAIEEPNPAAMSWASDSEAPVPEPDVEEAAGAGSAAEQGMAAIAPLAAESLEDALVLATVEAESIVDAAGGWAETTPVVGTAEEPDADTETAETVAVDLPGVEAEAVSVVEGAFLEEPEATEPAPEIEPELVITETMAEVFLRQGHRPLALAVYAQLLERDPDNLRLQDAIARLRGELLGERGSAASGTSAGGSGPEEPVGSFLARVLGPDLADEEPAVAAVPTGPLSGRPTRPAEDPALSLSTIFGEDMRRRSVMVSGPDGQGHDAEPTFDEFFGTASVPVGAGGDEAELEQFNAWLRSLQR